FRNRLTFLLTGLDIEAKAALVRRTFEAHVDLEAIREVSWQLVRSDHEDAGSNAEAVAYLTVTAKDADPNAIGRRAFANVAVEMGLASYPGFTMTAPPGDADPFGIYWPALVPKDEITEVVVLPDGRRLELAPTPGGSVADVSQLAGTHQPQSRVGGATTRVPLGRLVDARSGDKGGNANVGVWVRSDEAYAWLQGFLTGERFRELVPDAAGLEVRRYELPNLRALNLVVVGLLGMGVSESDRIDPQAKGLGEYLRSRLVDVPERLLA
ncbi:MAG: exopolyphosphatase, partial [Actinobacteria bacterium]|nr:exopolyphosphatase [Actinomycetota bacterium]